MVSEQRAALRRRVADLMRAHPELPLRDVIALIRLQDQPELVEMLRRLVAENAEQKASDAE